jgi:hypothetical protein
MRDPREYFHTRNSREACPRESGERESIAARATHYRAEAIFLITYQARKTVNLC